MAEGTDRVIELDAKAPSDPRPIEADIVRRRGELTTLVAELNRRGHDFMDVGLQVGRHALGVTVTVLAVGAVTACSITLAVWRARRHDTVTTRGGRLREALGRMIDRPERVAVAPTVTQRVIGAAGSAAAAFLIKAALERVTSRPAVSRLRSVSPPTGKGRPGTLGAEMTASR
jgi:hypothetical protein